jgi:hypothetical protein
MQSEHFLEKIFARLNELGIPEHGRGVKVSEVSGYSPSHVSEVLSGKKNCTKRFFDLAMSGLSLCESSPSLPIPSHGQGVSCGGGGNLTRKQQILLDLCNEEVLLDEAIKYAEKEKLLNELKRERAEKEAA